MIRRACVAAGKAQWMPTCFARKEFAVAVVILLGPLITASTGFSATYDEARSTAVNNCRAIDPSAYQSGLLFNPDGYRSYYVRSECFQRIAVEFRDASLCAEVKQRYSLFSSSWGYSHAQCLKLVHGGITEDEKTLTEIKRRYLHDAVRLSDFRVERNGNGRDFDIIPSFTGEYGHGYTLRFDIFPTAFAKTALMFHSDGYFIDSKSNLRVFVRQEEIRKRFPDFILGRPYTVRATLILSIGNGGQGGRWSDAFIERIFPERERSQSLDREIRF
jgi:hypothetical protein